MVESENSQKLATYINSLHGFIFVEEIRPYQHIGATLTD
jgi:hypothetical protein